MLHALEADEDFLNSSLNQLELHPQRRFVPERIDRDRLGPVAARLIDLEVEVP